MYKKVLIIDNYDSFTYNLVQLVGIMLKKLWQGEILVRRNDETSLKEIEKIAPNYIIISPGPCTPKEAGISVEVIRKFSGKIPILGVCLGHQCIGFAFGGRIVHAKKLMHGKTSLIFHTQKDIFASLPVPFEGMRYHSLAVERESLPEELEIIAESDDGEIMGIKHKSHPTFGIQFHPESIGTSLNRWKNFPYPPEKWDFESWELPEGVIILRNFLSLF